ncbi:MAG: hypothetical protein ACTHJP_12445 [Rhodanobacteraceae bacterium]
MALAMTGMVDPVACETGILSGAARGPKTVTGPLHVVSVDVRSGGRNDSKKNRPHEAAGLYRNNAGSNQCFIASLALTAATLAVSAAWPALWAASFMASIALAWVEAGAGAVLAGIAAVEAGAASAALEAAAAALWAEAAALAACEAALAAAEAALAAFSCASLAADWADWPELPPQADNAMAIDVATAAASTVRVNFIGDLLDWAVESHGSGRTIKPRLAE